VSALLLDERQADFGILFLAPSAEDFARNAVWPFKLLPNFPR